MESKCPLNSKNKCDDSCKWFVEDPVDETKKCVMLALHNMTIYRYGCSYDD